MPPITLDQPLCTFDQETEPFVYEVAWPPSTLPTIATAFNAAFNAAAKAPTDLVKALLGSGRSADHTAVLDVEGDNSESFADIEIFARLVSSIYGNEAFSLNNVFKIGGRNAITDGNVAISGGAGSFANLGSSSNEERSGRVEIYAVPVKSGESALTTTIFNRSNELLAAYALDEGVSRGSVWGNEILTAGIPTHQQNGIEFPKKNNIYGLRKSLRVPTILQVQTGRSDTASYFYIWLPERLKTIASASAITGNPEDILWSSDNPTEGFFMETQLQPSAATQWAVRYVYRTRNAQSALFEGTHLHLTGAFNA